MTYEEYQRALELLRDMMNTPEYMPKEKELLEQKKEMLELAKKISAYEEKHYPIAKPCWLTRLIFRIRQQMGW